GWASGVQAMEGAGGGRMALCVLCGLPAAGKSTLAHALRRELPLRQGWDCALLTYDDLIPEEAAVLDEPPLVSAAPLPRPGRGGERPLCLVLDDNFYYRSMRREVHRLARAHSLGFCQLFLQCPLEQCLQRNRLRGRPVPEGTILRMAQRLEAPEPERNPWEQNSLILSSSGCAPEEEPSAGLMGAFGMQIISLLATALENPVKQNEDNTEQKEADRAICAASAVHRADQMCRRIVSQAMKEAKDKNVLSSEMKSLAEELNKLKAEFLEDLRQGSHLENEAGQTNHSSDPATSVLASFQLEATNIVNKYILK
ncbi:PSTK kinase, partial [Penelope pileata]|nr:PSTK kinase [Penelope pileata]